MLTTEQQSVFESIVMSIYPDYDWCFDKQCSSKNIITYDKDKGSYKLRNDYNPYDESGNKYIGFRSGVNQYTLLIDVVEDINILLKCYVYSYNDGYDDGYTDGYNYMGREPILLPESLR